MCCVRVWCVRLWCVLSPLLPGYGMPPPPLCAVVLGLLVCRLFVLGLVGCCLVVLQASDIGRLTGWLVGWFVCSCLVPGCVGFDGSFSEG